MNKLILFIPFIWSLFTGFLLADRMTAEEVNEAVLHEGDLSFNTGVKIGTLGLGLDISKSINEFVSFRFNVNGGHYSTTYKSEYNSAIDSDVTHNFQTIGLLTDFYLSKLRVTAGAYFNNNKTNYITKPTATKSIHLNGNDYGVDKIKQIQSEITFDKVSPYFGIGWGNNGYIQGWNMTLDVGLMYYGKPNIDINVLTNNATPEIVNKINADMRIEKKIQEKDFAKFPFYPVIMLGINYSF